MMRTRLACLVRMGLLLLVCGAFGGCAAPAMDEAALATMVRDFAEYMQRDYVLRPNDQITIRVITLNPRNTQAGAPMEGGVQDIVVPPTGNVALAHLEQTVPAAGRPMSAFRADVTEAYRRVFNDANVQVSLRQPSASAVYVTGEVRQPGSTPYQPAMTVSQAVAAAGGIAISAKERDVRVLRPATDGRVRTFRVDLESVLHSGAPDFLLLPGDVVYCQPGIPGRLANHLHLWIWRMTPLSVPVGIPTIF